MSAPDPWIVDVDAMSFATEVVERSRQLPVVLDFWATWCEPCRILGPLLEKRARDGAGRFLLAKVDIDRNPELAQALRVQSIPAVLAIVDGKPVDGFQGALPEAQLDEFLERVAPGGGPAASPELERAGALAEEGELDQAIDVLRAHLRNAADDTAARLLLADLLVQAERVADAKRVLAKLGEEEAASAEARALADRIAFAESSDSLDQLRQAVAAAPEDASARLELGRGLAAAKDYEAALEELLEAVRLDASAEGGAAKRKMLEIFDLLGLEDPLANDYRFKLSLELFS